MKLQSILTGALLLFVGVCVIYLAVSESGRDAAADKVVARSNGLVSETGSVGSGADHYVVAYYFHGARRCPTCRRIETLAEKALSTTFSEFLTNRRLVWQVLNFEDPENRHFVEDYELYGQSLILSEMLGGEQVRWKNLDRVWELVRNEEAFIGYVQEEVRAFLGEA